MKGWLEISTLCRRSRKYWFNPHTGELVEQLPGNQPEGLPPYGSLARAACFRGRLQRFLLGGNVIKFREDGGDFLWVRGARLSLGDPNLRLALTILGPIALFRIACPSFRAIFVDWRLGAMIQQHIDPTYDGIDEMTDNFPGEILRQQAKILSGQATR